MWNHIMALLCWFCCVNCATLNLRTGAPCTGADGVRGRCVSLYKCPSAVVIYLHYNFGYNNIPDLPKVCNEDAAAPVVCCTDCYIDEQERSNGLVLDRFGKLVNLRQGPIAKAICAKYFQELPYECRGQKDNIGLFLYHVPNKTCHTYTRSAGFAVGGRDAKKREFPHAALLGYGDNVESAQWVCGGTVISENYVLTAAHCTEAPLLGPVKFVSLGLLRRSDPIDTWRIHRVRKAVPHPEYRSPARYHDIALLQLEDEIQFSEDVLPACLQYIDLTFGSVQGIGWGRLGHRKSLADTLQAVELQSFPNANCSELYPPHRLLQDGYNETTQVCYGNPYNVVDTCDGDSGGPVHVDYHNCQYTVAGVTSFGRDCGVEAGAGMYTRVQYYVPWIEKIVWPYFAYTKDLFFD